MNITWTDTDLKTHELILANALGIKINGVEIDLNNNGIRVSTGEDALNITPVSINSIVVSANKSTKVSTPASKKKTPKTQTNNEQDDWYHQTFELFWDVYGKKKGRHKCFLKWKRLKVLEVREIGRAINSYIAATPDVQYRKNPLTWLNGKCWEDEILLDEVLTEEQKGDIERQQKREQILSDL